MIEAASQEWTENHAKWWDSVLSHPNGQFLIAHLRYITRSTPLNLKLEPGVDYAQVNAFVNRDREASNGLIDRLVRMSQVKEKKERLPDEGWATKPLLREDEKESPPVKKKK